jgi:hypothetical protein
MVIARNVALAVAFWASACATWWGDGECRLHDPAAPGGTFRAPPNLDLSDVRLFRNYVGVTHVGPYGHYFAVSYHHVERNGARVRAELDANGPLRMYVDGSWWGGLAGVVKPKQPPPELAPLASALNKELRRRCPAGRSWSVAYDSSYRLIDVIDFVAHDIGGGGNRAHGGGWVSHSRLRTDRDLTRILGVAETWSGFGSIEAPGGTQWVARDAGPMVPGRPAAGPIGGGGEFDQVLLAAARRVTSGAPPAAIAELPVPAPDALLPPGFRSRVNVVVTIRDRGQGRPGDRNGPAKQRLSLDLRSAVFGPAAEARVSTYVAGTHVEISARLTPHTVRTPRPTLVREPYRGTLTLHIEDQDGNQWQRDYPATGPILLQGDQVAAPTGFELPGSSSPSKEYDALSGSLPNGTRFRGIDFRVDVSMFDDPRRP